METIAHFEESYKMTGGVASSVRRLVQGQRLLGKRPIVISSASRNAHLQENGVEVVYLKGVSLNRFYPGCFVSRPSMNLILDFCQERRVGLVHIHV
jgi:hypothetical protein